LLYLRLNNNSEWLIEKSEQDIDISGQVEDSSSSSSGSGSDDSDEEGDEGEETSSSVSVQAVQEYFHQQLVDLVLEHGGNISLVRGWKTKVCMHKQRRVVFYISMLLYAV
jgi:hypothetical protein